jgi:hypothetical protein
MPEYFFFQLKVGRLADPGLPADLLNRHAVITLPDDERLLGVRELRCLHRGLSSVQPDESHRKTLIPNEGVWWGQINGSGLTGIGGSPAGVSGSMQFKSGTAFAGRSDIVIDNAGQVAIGTSNPSATLEVSGTLKLAGGTGAEVCDPDHYGQIRRNPTTGAFQICVSR